MHHCERKLSWIRYEILRQWKQGKVLVEAAQHHREVMLLV
jgi:hypothetical protein